MMPAAALAYALFDVERRDSQNRMSGRRSVRSDRTSTRRRSTRSAGARVTS
jgi:hypothetical protein